jgi:hypothetical protein
MSLTCDTQRHKEISFNPAVSTVVCISNVGSHSSIAAQLHKH